MIKTLEDLTKIKNENFSKVNQRLQSFYQTSFSKTKQILVCYSGGCHNATSKSIIEYLQKSIVENNLQQKVSVIPTGCFGLCSLGPVVIVYPDGVFYKKMDLGKIKEVFEKHILKDEIVFDYAYNVNAETQKIIPLKQTKFYKSQVKIALQNVGIVCPEKIEDYIALDGYLALYNVLNKKPEDTISEIIASGLRGRGGGGFPTGTKWQLTKNSIATEKYVCCNADEGDPGAFMDRAVLEGDPHSVLEAMAIAGYCIGSNQGYIYVRAEYPIAIERLKIAISQAKSYGVLGNNIFGTNFSFDIELRLGSGAFVCGEETALMTSIEGKRGEPKPRPPYPAVSGLFGKPTLLNNVETYANVTKILLNGADWYNKIGTEKSKGTKVFALSGKINNTGLIEVPMGTKLKDIIYEIGDGIANNKQFKLAQTGGPSGGCIPNSLIDTPLDYENLTAIGSMMGSGGLIVMDETTCVVDICKFYLEFSVDESCGKCTPCRIGNKRLLEMLEKITNGKANLQDLEKLEQLCKHIKESSLCGLGQSSPNPILSSLRYFKDEFIEHIKNKNCPAKVCKSLTVYRINKDKCVGCSACSLKCPVKAISGTIKSPFTIDEQKCIRCGICKKTCKFGAIEN